jgi:hypothetical protein
MMPHMKTHKIWPLFLIYSVSVVLNSTCFSQAKAVSAKSQSSGIPVPFVGCASDGQVGPLGVPKGREKFIEMAPGKAQRVAYYEAENGDGVLAPRGWYCFSTYGSNGSSLYLSPDPIDAHNIFSSDRKGFAGEAIQISFSVGDTSGRFEVAKIIARVFPAYKSFVEDVISEGIEPASDFPFGPYPADKLKYLSKSALEFETPPNAEGLGTNSWLQSNGMPIHGLAILFGEEHSLTMLAVRLSKSNDDLIQSIINQVEKENARSVPRPD